MDHKVEKLLYSRRDTAEALSLSVRSIDYLISSGRLSIRRVGGKILVPATAIRQFARGDHPQSIRSKGTLESAKTFPEPAGEPRRRFGPRSEESDPAQSLNAKSRG